MRADYDTGSPFPTFAVTRPAVDNTRVDMSPHWQSVFADAVDAIQTVDLTFDALISEVDVSKMRILLSDVLFDKATSGDGKKVSIRSGRTSAAFKKSLGYCHKIVLLQFF